MNTKSMMRVMLIGLGGIGAVGVLAMFFPDSGITGRLLGTAILSSIAIGIVMAATKQLDNERKRDGALLAMGVTIASFGLSMLGIWSGLFGFSDEWKVISTAMVLAGCGLAAVPAVVLYKTESGKWSGVTGVVCSLAAFVMFALAIWDVNFGTPVADEFAMTGMAFAVCGGFAALSIYGITTSQGVLKWVTKAGMIVSALGFVVAMTDIWLWSNEEVAIASQLMVVAGVLAHANMACRVRSSSTTRIVLMMTLMFSVITAGSLIMLIEQTSGFASSRFWYSGYSTRLAAGFGLLTACGTLALIVMQRMSRNVGVFLKKAEFTSMHVRCPNCAMEQDAPVGVSGCLQCGMQFGITMSKPQCAGCGYDTLGVRGDACPECGEKLPPRGVRLQGFGEAGKVDAEPAKIG